jgi:type IV fimbrial biogenesis protein FimT
MNAPQRLRQAGFTLIELMVVVALVAILLALAAPSFRDTIARNRLEGVASELATDFQYARSEAVSRNAQVGLFVGTNCYTVFTVGSTDATSCTALGTGATAIKSVNIDTGSAIGLAFASNNTKAFIQFDPVRGIAADSAGADWSGSVTVSSGVGLWQLRTEVTNFGRVKTCSPSATFKGYPSC